MVYMKLSVISAPNLCLSELSDAIVEYIVRMEDTAQQTEEIIQVHVWISSPKQTLSLNPISFLFSVRFIFFFYLNS